MKKKVSIFIALLLSVIVIYGGSGVNSFFYCCDDCQDEGLSAIIEHKCCEIHHHHHHIGGLIQHTDEHICEQNLCENTQACGLERISVNWTLSTQKDIQLQPSIIYLSESGLHTDTNFQSELFEIKSERFGKSSQKPPNQSNNTYFSLLTVLII